MYDGPHQITYFEKMIKQAKVGNNFIILRKRYLSEDNSFGINLSNRGALIGYSPLLNCFICLINFSISCVPGIN